MSLDEIQPGQIRKFTHPNDPARSKHVLIHEFKILKIEHYGKDGVIVFGNCCWSRPIQQHSESNEHRHSIQELIGSTELIGYEPLSVPTIKTPVAIVPPSAVGKDDYYPTEPGDRPAPSPLVTCVACQGTGGDERGGTCWRCRGSGSVRREDYVSSAAPGI